MTSSAHGTIVISLVLGIAVWSVGCRSGAPAAAGARRSAGNLRWWRGNLHTHSLWSDGDGYPEMIASWYREHGYDFLVITDHNVPPREKWIDVARSVGGMDAHTQYRERFGADWVVDRMRDDTLQVRLRHLDEYRARIEEPGRFLLIPGEEITEYLGGKAAHTNAINLTEPIEPRGGSSIRDMQRNNVAAVVARSHATGRPMLAILNHPNWLWSLAAADIAAISDLRFFEIYNGHPDVNNAGDSTHPSTDRLWDLALTERLARGGELLYGVATDDAHDYHAVAPSKRNPGRGWVVVRAPSLTAESIIAAMARGDFYASTGVELTDIRRAWSRISLRIRAEPGVTYTTQFIGTRATRDGEVETSHVGEVLAEVPGTSPEYELRGDELYVRARVTSSTPKINVTTPGEMERAWTQPFIPR